MDRQNQDSTTHFARRNRHLQTTIAGWLFPLSLALRYVHGMKDVAEALEAFAGLLLGTAAADAGRAKVKSVADAVKRTVGIGKGPPTATLPLILAALILASTTGCISNGGLTKLATQLAKDPATVSVRLTTVYGTLYFTRTNPRTNTLTHSISPDGAVSVGDGAR